MTPRRSWPSPIETTPGCSARLRCQVRRLLGKWPTWPEAMRGARRRYANRFVEYLRRGHQVGRLLGEVKRGGLPFDH